MNKPKSDPIQLAQHHLDNIENIREKSRNVQLFPYPNLIRVQSYWWRIITKCGR